MIRAAQPEAGEVLEAWVQWPVRGRPSDVCAGQAGDSKVGGRGGIYDDGHYALLIPFWHEEPQLPNNKRMAESRLNSLYRKLEKDAKLREKYMEGMQDLLDKGHAIEVLPAEIGWQDGKVWYLPHHPLVNPNKDKPCIVFDCADQHLGVSLNSKVLQGPDLTNKLIGVLTRFCLHQIALMADVEAMFRQVWVEANNQDAVLFLWWPRGNTNKAPRTYSMTVHLFGGMWSPELLYICWAPDCAGQRSSVLRGSLWDGKEKLLRGRLPQICEHPGGSDCVNKGVEGPARLRRFQPQEVDEQSSGSLRGDTIAQSVHEGQGEEHWCTHGGESLRGLLEYGGRYAMLHCIILSYAMLHCIVLSYAILYCIVLS